MPWDASQFKTKNKKLKGHSATVGAAAATNALKHGYSEASAIKIGNSAGDKALKKKKPKVSLRKGYVPHGKAF
jgi:uncharacterized protein YdaT